MLKALIYLTCWISFVCIQAIWPEKNEFKLFWLSIVMLSVVLWFDFSMHLFVLGIVGILLGVLIEVGMAVGTRQQIWRNGTFFGVPHWLPILWGYGFMVIYLLGDYMAQYFGR